MRKQSVPRILGGLPALYLLSGAAFAQTVTLTVNVITPSRTPSGDTLMVVGSAIQLSYRTFPEAAHNEQAWAQRLWIPLQFLFGK